MTCDRCGCDIPENQTSCPNCGYKVDQSDSDFAPFSGQSEYENAPESQIIPRQEENVEDAANGKEALPQREITSEEEITSADKASSEDETDGKNSEEEYAYPTMRCRGDGEGIPDMDLGKTTRYYSKKRSSLAKKTRWEKLVAKFRPKDDAEPLEILQAANKNAGFAIFLYILSFIGFVLGFAWALNPYQESVLNIFFCIAGFFISIVSIEFSDVAAEYYNKFYKSEIIRSKILKFISHAMFWITAGMSAVAIVYKLFIATGFLQATGNGYRWLAL